MVYHRTQTPALISSYPTDPKSQPTMPRLWGGMEAPKKSGSCVSLSSGPSTCPEKASSGDHAGSATRPRLTPSLRSDSAHLCGCTVEYIGLAGRLAAALSRNVTHQRGPFLDLTQKLMCRIAARTTSSFRLQLSNSCAVRSQRSVGLAVAGLASRRAEDDEWTNSALPSGRGPSVTSHSADQIMTDRRIATNPLISALCFHLISS